MRFCMVTTYYPPYHFGGDATYIRALSQALVARGHQVEVIHCVDAYALKEGYDKLPPSSTVITEEGIIVHRIQSPFKLLSPLITQQTGRPGLKLTQLQNLLQKDFDVINFHNISLIGGPAVLALGQAPVKLYTLHEYWLLCATHVFWKNNQQPCDRKTCIRCSLKSGIPPQLWRYTQLRHKAVKQVDALLSPSDYTAKRHRQAGFSGPILTLPLFSTLHPGRPDRTLHKTTKETRPQFLFVGRVTAAKGIEPLLATFAKLPDYDLVVVGDGALLPALQRAYARCSNIRFVGRIRQQLLMSFYQKTTALIFPSLMMETFGLTTVEAFACGVPVIARDAGGNRELIEKTGGGVIYHSEDDLRAAIRAIAHDRPLQQHLSKLAYQGYRDHYTEKIHINTYLSHIRSIQVAKGLVNSTAPTVVS